MMWQILNTPIDTISWKWRISHYVSISALLHCTDQGYIANGEVSIGKEMAAAPGQFLALQDFNALKEESVMLCR